MKSIFLFLSIILTGSLYSQHDTINRLNEKGLKTGYWRLYLDDRMGKIDSTKASFIAYEVYDDGKLILSYRRTSITRRLHPVYSGEKAVVGKPQLVNGTFKYYNKKNKLRFEETYKNGYPQYSTTYKITLGASENKPLLISDYFDFTKRYENQIGSCYHELYFTPTSVNKYWYKKGDKGWREYLIKE